MITPEDINQAVKNLSKRRGLYYMLDGKIPKPIDDVLEWGKFFQKDNRTVEQTKIGDVEVSTVFIGLDHSFGHGEPLLFETMIFGGPEDGYQQRYSTWDEAVAGHRFACEKVVCPD